MTRITIIKQYLEELQVISEEFDALLADNDSCGCICHSSRYAAEQNAERKRDDLLEKFGYDKD